MSEELPNNPHNNLFVTSMSRLSEARSLIETQLPPAVVQDLDLDSLQIGKRDLRRCLSWAIQVDGSDEHR